MHTPCPDVIIFGAHALTEAFMTPGVHALLADPLAPLLAQMQLRPGPAAAPRAGERSYLCVWRMIGSRLFLEAVLRPDLSGGEVVFGQDYFASTSAGADFFTAPEKELRQIRAWLCGKRHRWNREPLWLPANWVRDPVELVFACKGAELRVERADLMKPDPLQVVLPDDERRCLQFPSGGRPVCHSRKPRFRNHIDDLKERIQCDIVDPTRAAIRARVMRLLQEDQTYV